MNSRNISIKMSKYYMDIARSTSAMSKAIRAKVGGILVSSDGLNIISFGWNGTPHGFDNTREDVIVEPKELSEKFVTRPEVIHCEQNIYAKVAASTHSSVDSVLFITLSPCFECSKLIIQAKTRAVIYYEEYRDTKPLQMLMKAGVHCITFGDIDHLNVGALL